jgi:hypothetical protein
LAVLISTVTAAGLIVIAIAAVPYRRNSRERANVGTAQLHREPVGDQIGESAD